MVKTFYHRGRHDVNIDGDDDLIQNKMFQEANLEMTANQRHWYSFLEEYWRSTGGDDDRVLTTMTRSTLVAFYPHDEIYTESFIL